MNLYDMKFQPFKKKKFLAFSMGDRGISVP